MKTGMLYDEVAIWVFASTLTQYYRWRNPFDSCATPFACLCLGTRSVLLVDNGAGHRMDEMPP